MIDCNRGLDDPTSIPPISDGTMVPGNQNLSPADRVARAEACFWPYHGEIGRRIDTFLERGVKPAIVIIHSFTPEMNGFKRPWHLGVLWEGTSSINALDVTGRAVGKVRAHEDLGEALHAIVDEADLVGTANG